MRDIPVRAVAEAVERLFIDANTVIAGATLERLKTALEEERSPTGKGVIEELLLNATIAREERIPICQDTGLAVVFLEIGQEVHFTEGGLMEAVAAGARNAYEKGYLRKSCCDPFSRRNTGDNMPAIVHTAVVPGDQLRIVVMPKGGGSENCSSVRMLTPSQGMEGVKSFVLEMVTKAGPNPCPPITVGVGVGGNFEQSALLSKEALLVPFGQRNDDPTISELESAILDEINSSGIGPGGYGGTVTALDVHVKVMPCHIASLPVAVNIQCHAHRIKEAIL